MATLSQFTDRVRTVIRLSEDEAARLGHRYYGTEHLLLGIVREGEGNAARVLTDLGVTLPVARDAVEAVLAPGNEFALLYTGRAPGYESALARAVVRSRQMGHHFNGTEHLALVLAKSALSVASSVFRHLGTDLAKLEERTIAVIDPERDAERGNPALIVDDLGLPAGRGEERPIAQMTSDELDRLISRAFRTSRDNMSQLRIRAADEAHRFNHPAVGTEHLLLALAAERDGAAAQVLAGAGVTLDPARAAVEALFGVGSEPIIFGREESARLRHVLDLALDHADPKAGRHADSGHVLLAMLDQDGGSAFRILDHLGVDRAALRSSALARVEQDGPGSGQD
jgi:ATP-dependent Clp protease ATP-binding subunit ClpA